VGISGIRNVVMGEICLMGNREFVNVKLSYIFFCEFPLYMLHLLREYV
jgi:hypothetical protein